ncbi:NAD(P)-binding protein [Arcobacter lacus]|uniref:NAD(P)-binding protein n=1 Tax=Arcobacter lacus TaxID=1912876 RepID=UPI0021BB06C3|nr:NAD(P)-binding protein [Arcobacter lacus]MCT7910417.1 NAD(P)-binding protein [Arcobacter lacus]
MKKVEIAVIGSGIGGAMIASLNQKKDLILFEKDKNLGGCASTFKRFGEFFNTGATTFVGYEENHVIKKIFDEVGVKPDLIESHVAIRTIQNKKIVDRVENFEEFLTNLNSVYYHTNNRIFWKTIKEIDEKFWKLKKIYFSKYSFKAYTKTVLFIVELFKEYGFLLFKTADGYINEVLPNISKEYKAFIDSQLLITLQTTSKDLSLLAMSLGLSYPFHKVYYSNGGMGKIVEDLLKEVNVQKKEEIISIERFEDKYKIISTKDEYIASKIILNSTIFESSKLFLDEDIKRYYEKFSFNDQSAFVVYLKLNSKKNFLHHYQIILKENIPNCISNSFFVSFSHKNDEKLSKNGYSITISTHTKALFWQNLSEIEYEEKKEFTKNYIINQFLNNFENIKFEDIKISFCATSKTFNRYINRLNCGGKAITIKNLTELPSCNTPFKGLYNIGDTVFAGQGWPGIAIGVNVLNKELNANS